MQVAAGRQARSRQRVNSVSIRFIPKGKKSPKVDFCRIEPEESFALPVDFCPSIDKIVPMSQAVIYLDSFREGQRRVCGECSASGEHRKWMMSFPLCQLARLENLLERRPKDKDAEEFGIDTSSIPEGCPNGYVSLPSREMR
jgi:hypothetical protein